MTIGFDGDLSPIAEYADLIENLALAMDEKPLKRATEFMARSTGAAFYSYADEVAKENPLRLHHVYEWGKTLNGGGNIGNPSARLFRIDMSGPQSNKTLTYQFLASHTVVPKGESMTGIQGDTRQAVHIFTWKAAVMEDNTPVTVYPSPDKGTLAFAPYPNYDRILFTQQPVYVKNPGGKPTTGAFNELWVGFWQAVAEQIVHEDIVIPTEEELYKQTTKAIANFTLSRAKAVPLKVSIQTKSKKNMKRAAVAIADDVLNGYLRAARQREAFARGTVSGI